jgi:hypothetical protein
MLSPHHLHVRARILATLAASGLGVGACKPAPDAPKPVVPEASSPAAATPVVPVASSVPSATVAPTPFPATPTPLVAPDPNAEPAVSCAKTERYCLAPRQPPPAGPMSAPRDPKSVVYDDKGCVDKTQIGGSCHGFRAAAGPTLAGGKCCYDVCKFQPAPCGRPLTIDGQVRLAPLAPRADFLSVVSLDLPPNQMARDAWAYDARCEHASVAAFSALSLQLLSLGAPAELLADVHRAALDEISHTTICFGLAAHLGTNDDASVGPGALSSMGLRLDVDAASLARETVRDACLGETLASLVLGRAAELSAPELSSKLRGMAEDELRHAELGFRVVAFLVAQGGEPVAAAAREAMAEGTPSLSAPRFAQEADRCAFLACGRLDAQELASVLRDFEGHMRPLLHDALG